MDRNRPLRHLDNADLARLLITDGEEAFREFVFRFVAKAASQIRRVLARLSPQVSLSPPEMQNSCVRILELVRRELCASVDPAEIDRCTLSKLVQSESRKFATVLARG